MNFIGARALVEMQNGDPRRLIRGSRSPIFFPWRPTQRPEKYERSTVFVATASDLSVWSQSDVRMLEESSAPVRLVRPGTMTQQDMLALPPTVECYMFDVWCGDEAVRRQLLEVLLPNMPTINNFVM